MSRLLYLIALMLTHCISGVCNKFEVGADKEFASIKQAISLAETGDTIFINKGTYSEGTILIDKPLVVIGVEKPELDGQFKHAVLRVQADSVTITGLTIKNVGTSYIEDKAAIRVIKGRNCVIKGNYLEDTFFGIYLERCKYCIVENNKIIGKAEHEMSSGNAIHLWYCKNIIIKNNHAEGHRDGIYLEFVDHSLVTKNFVKDNIRYGLHFMFSNDDKYIDNQFISNSAGVAVMFSKNILMDSNLFSNNWGSSSYGLLLKDITDSEIKNNKFIENTIGIFAEGVNRVKLHNNNIEKNGWALKILGSCSDNIVTANNFINNTFDISTNTRHNFNTYDGNFWSEYSGRYDLNKDGIADVPFRPVKLFSFMIANMSSSTILMRSLLIDLVNYAEKIVPVITPNKLIDNKPRMEIIDNDRDKGVG